MILRKAIKHGQKTVSNKLNDWISVILTGVEQRGGIKKIVSKPDYAHDRYREEWRKVLKKEMKGKKSYLQLDGISLDEKKI
jgi:formylmethanofuran dehydrogenase subunit C